MIDLPLSSQERLISVVVPVFNSQDTLTPLVRRIDAVFRKLELPFEVIMINDGSQDQSWETIYALTNKYPNIRGMNLLKNFGQHNALLAGIRAARGAVIVTIDDDLQIPPEEIPRLLAKLDEGYDVIYGKPQKEQHNFFRDITSLLTKKIMQIGLGINHVGYLSSFRVFHSALREVFADFQAVRVSIDVLLSWSTDNFAYVLVEHDKRFSGRSGYSLHKLIRHAVEMITGFSERPIRFATLVGGGFILFGLIMLLYVVVKYFAVDAVLPGFTFLASLISIFSGVQLFSLGVIGEYISHIHLATLNRPAYVVVSDTGKNRTTT